MFARFVVCQSKVGRSEQVGSKLKNDILPICRSSWALSAFLRRPTRQAPKGWSASVSGPREKMPRNITASTMTRSPTCRS
jgi:hypothetical protein